MAPVSSLSVELKIQVMAALAAELAGTSACSLPAPAPWLPLLPAPSLESLVLIRLDPGISNLLEKQLC